MGGKKKQLGTFFSIGLATLMLSGCDNMRDDNQTKPYEQSTFFKNGSSAREPVKGTVPRGHLQNDDHFYRGLSEGALAETFPMPINRALLLRGEERYNIYCIVCHDRLGYGEGIVVKRGFKQPPSFHEERLKTVPIGHFFIAMTNGFGEMSSYAAELSALDRWAVAAYIRTLQYSQSVSANSLSTEKKQTLDKEGLNTQKGTEHEHTP